MDVAAQTARGGARDLWLQEAWVVVDEQGTLGERGLGWPLWVPANSIAWVELVPPTTPEEDADG